jgi:hypothetical protein
MSFHAIDGWRFSEEKGWEEEFPFNLSLKV